MHPYKHYSLVRVKVVLIQLESVLVFLKFELLIVGLSYLITVEVSVLVAGGDGCQSVKCFAASWHKGGLYLGLLLNLL